MVHEALNAMRHRPSIRTDIKSLVLSDPSMTAAAIRDRLLAIDGNAPSKFCVASIRQSFLDDLRFLERRGNLVRLKKDHKLPSSLKSKPKRKSKPHTQKIWWDPYD